MQNYRIKEAQKGDCKSNPVKTAVAKNGKRQ
jgi:hypothetical protein